jgi:hypothetical protein
MYQYNMSLNVQCFHCEISWNKKSVLQNFVYLWDLWLMWQWPRGLPSSEMQYRAVQEICINTYKWLQGTHCPRLQGRRLWLQVHPKYLYLPTRLQAVNTRRHTLSLYIWQNSSWHRTYNAVLCSTLPVKELQPVSVVFLHSLYFLRCISR